MTWSLLRTVSMPRLWTQHPEPRPSPCRTARTPAASQRPRLHTRPVPPPQPVGIQTAAATANHSLEMKDYARQDASSQKKNPSLAHFTSLRAKLHFSISSASSSCPPPDNLFSKYFLFLFLILLLQIIYPKGNKEMLVFLECLVSEICSMCEVQNI